MAQRFTFFGSRLVQLDRQALFCDPKLLAQTQQMSMQHDKPGGRFLSLRQVLHVSELPPGDTHGLQYDEVTTTTTAPDRRVLVRVLPFLESDSNNNNNNNNSKNNVVRHTHDPLIQENMRLFRAENTDNHSQDNNNNNDSRVPLRVLWTDCWRVCAAWWGVSTEIVDHSHKKQTTGSDSSLGMPLVRAIVQDDTDDDETIMIDARHEHGPNVAQRLALAILRTCFGFKRPCETSHLPQVQSPPATSKVSSLSYSQSDNASPFSLATALINTSRNLKPVVPR
mgnify:CR=1 FL=1